MRVCCYNSAATAGQSGDAEEVSTDSSTSYRYTVHALDEKLLTGKDPWIIATVVVGHKQTKQN